LGATQKMTPPQPAAEVLLAGADGSSSSALARATALPF